MRVKVDKLRSQCEGIILSYRLGRKTQYPKEILVKVLQVEIPETGQMIGWNIAWPSKDPKIRGRIMGLHGRKGMLRARFSKSVPGQALGSTVKIYK